MTQQFAFNDAAGKIDAALAHLWGTDAEGVMATAKSMMTDMQGASIGNFVPNNLSLGQGMVGLGFKPLASAMAPL